MKIESSSPPAPGPPAELPAGTVTFLLTDIEGSTRQWEAAPDAMAVALEQHNRLLTEVITGHDGVVVVSRGEGDSFFAVFAGAADALNAAAITQEHLAAEAWPPPCAVKVRMALHTGEADLRDGEYHGHLAINRCARLRAAAHGGQVLLTQATRDLGAPLLAESLGFRDLGEHRLRDLAAPVHVYQLEGPGLAPEFPPILTLADRTSNLPIQATTFVGRAGELAQVAALVDPGRLVTLIGPGGSGKTRLAVQVAAELTGRFPDGPWLVELAALADPRLVAPQIAAVLHQSEFDAAQLAAKRLLIVLDNCEQVIGACAEAVAALLRTCPGIAVLATSREPLNIAGEHTVRIGPLEPADATDLFVDRALLVRPDLDLSAPQLATIAAICARLDNIPLAIELAAARTRGMTPAEILGRLQDRFRLLTSRSTTTSERHQTLRAAVAWSYDLLEEPEKALFRGLSVFSGGWRMASAEAVCGPASADDGYVPDLVLTLVDKSLVLAGGQDTSRYWMLQTLREFGRDKLIQAGELAELERRHGEHFLALSASADWPTETWWLDRRVQDVIPDLDNFRAALRWSKSQPPETELGLVVGAAPLWMAAGGFAEGALALTQALERALAPSALRLKALERLAWLATEHGDFDSAASAATEALRLAEALGSRFTATPLALLGFTALQQGQHDQAGRLLEESLRIYQANGELTGVAQVRHHQAALAAKTGDPARAEALLDEVITIADQTRDTSLATYALLSAIPILVDAGRTAEARQRWLTAYQQAGPGGGSAVLHLALLGYAAAIAAAGGGARRAVVLTEIAMGLLSATGWQDDTLLAWFWKTVAPAYEALDAESLAAARAEAQRMLPGAALLYAASDDG
jgi:predicted ATPase/class 3 adenylate cyclase